MSTDDLASSGRTHAPARLLAAGHNFGPAIGGIERLGDGLARHVAPGATTVLARTPANANASTTSDVAAFDAFDASVPYGVVRRPLVGAIPPRWWAARRALRAELAHTEYDAVLALEWWPQARALTSIRPPPASAALVYGAAL